MAYRPEQIALLEAQREYFANDDHIRREVAVWADATPAERLSELAEMCAVAEHFMKLRGVGPDVPAWPQDTLELLARLKPAR